MFWLGVLPALLVLWIRKGVAESPVWLERQRHLRAHERSDAVSLSLIFRRGLVLVTLQSSILMGAFMLSYYAISFWYPTFLREGGHEPLGFLVVFNLGAIAGAALWGRLSETRLGRRGAVTCAALMGVVMVPLYLGSGSALWLGVGALLMGIGGPGMWGVVPTYLTERFPTAARGVGPGFAYHAGASVGSVTPALVGLLQDQGLPLRTAMSALIAGSLLTAMALMWLGPETRGRELLATD
jgi:MFS family permease